MKTATEVRTTLLQSRACIFWCPDCKEKNLALIQGVNCAGAQTAGKSSTTSNDSIIRANEVEITYLKLLNTEITNKNSLLKENNSLLNQKIETLARELDTLKNQASTLSIPESNMPVGTQPVDTLENFFLEYQERENRMKNIVIFNCPESMSNSKDIATQVIEQCMGASELDIQAFRLGKLMNGKNRPIKVICKSRDIAMSILQGARKLKHNPHLKNLAISQDRTPRQLEEYRKLKQIMGDRLNAGEANLKIIYRGGKPQIVSSQHLN